MKKILALVIILIFTTQINAQESYSGTTKKTQLKILSEKALKVDQEFTRNQKLHQVIMLNEMMQQATASQAVQRLDSLKTEIMNGAWVPGYKLLFDWGPGNQILKQEEFSYDDSASIWVPSNRETYEYSPSGDPVKITREIYNENTSQWEGDIKTDYTWNAGKIETEMIWRWDFSTTGWQNDRKGTYAYNTSGLLTSKIWEYWDETGSQWYIGYMEQHSYNASNQVVQILFSTWNNAQQIYEPMGKDEYQYHTNGKVSLYMASFYDTSPAQWIPERKSEYTYDGQGNNTILLNSSYDYMTTLWVPQDKTEKTYDAQNNLISQVFSWYDESNYMWVLGGKGEYSYNNSFSFNDLLVPFLFIDPETKELLNHMLTNFSYFFFDDPSQTWLQDEKGELFWTQLIINVEPAVADYTCQVYPNPASGYINVDVEKLSDPLLFALYDLHGRLVLQGEVYGKNNISLNDIQSGLYLYRIFKGQEIVKHDKLIINR